MRTMHTDIVREGWVARLPESWRPYALLMRLDRPIGAWLLFLPGLWGILLGRPDWWLVVLFAVGSVVMRGAGCVVNDMWDRDLDRQVERTAGRPLASGALRMRHAVALLVALLLIGLGILVQLNWLAIALGVGSLLLVVTYPLFKRFTYWPQLMLGFTFGWGAPMGYAAATGQVNLTTALLYAATILWILGYDTIYAHQDREDDALVGVRSTARLFAERSRAFVGVCYAGTLLLLAVCGVQAGLHWVFFVGLLAGGAMLFRQVVQLDIHDPALCLRLFKSNRDAGLVIAAGVLAAQIWGQW